jgi:anaerobic magnesium-protoporphyrin IX monomethyl ester cyclase
MITLINPLANVEVAGRFDITTPPLGLGYLASSLRSAGFKVQIIDDLVERLNFNQLIKRVKNSFMVGITSTTPTFSAALRYARKIKEALPSVFIILGGVHVSIRPFDAISQKYVDAVCVGEGERTLIEVAESMESGRTLDGIKGIIFKKGDKIVHGGLREPIPDLDSLPFPAYDLMPLEKYSVLGRKLQHFPVITSRGCPFSCRYCCTSLFMGKRFRARSAVNVVDEIEWLMSDFDARHIVFSDDIFTLSKRRVEAICEEIKRRKLEISWSCSSRVDTVSEQLLRKMKEAGCAAIYYGVESASEKILSYYNKGIRIETVRRAIELTKKAGIMTICSFIIGAPMETKEDMKATLKLALSLDPDYAQFSVLTPYPGTEIYEEARARNLLLTENYEHFTAGKPVLKNFYLSPEEISKFLRHCYFRFYFRPKFIFREIKRGNLDIILRIIRRAVGRVKFTGICGRDFEF